MITIQSSYPKQDDMHYQLFSCVPLISRVTVLLTVSQSELHKPDNMSVLYPAPVKLRFLLLSLLSETQTGYLLRPSGAEHIMEHMKEK